MAETDWLPILPDRPLRGHPPRQSEDRVEPFPITYPDLGASMTWAVTLPDRPARPRKYPDACAQILSPFEPIGILLPLSWAPILPAALAARSLPHRSELQITDPTFGNIAKQASLMAWAPILPIHSRVPRQTAGQTLQTVSAYAAAIVTPPKVPCVDLLEVGVTRTSLLGEAVATTDLLDETITRTALLGEGIC